MSERLGLDLNSLPVQMILSFVALVLLTATAIGLPSIWLIRDQTSRQAWAQVEQGSRATEALYTAKQNEITGLATLTAQRPTIRALIEAGEPADLLAYLRTLQTGAGLDLLLLCDANRQVITQAGQANVGTLCAAETPAGFQAMPAGDTAQVWYLAAHQLGDRAVDQPVTVIVGMHLDDDFAVQMRAETGLEHTLLVDGQPVATSLTGRLLMLAATPGLEGEFNLNGQPYYFSRIPLPEASLEGQLTSELALPVLDIYATQRRLAWNLAGGILVVALAASMLGVALARRIGRPLAALATGAAALSKGDLSSPLAVEANVREVTLVAQALDGARADLRRTLAELRHEKAWTDHLLEAIVEGIMTLDRQGRITFFSHGAERITDWKRDEVLGRASDSVFRLVDTDTPFSQLIPPPGQRRKIDVTLRDGRQAVLSISGARLLPPESGGARVALVFRDISEEEAVHRLLAHFLANVAHEFRTPLSALAASVELLMDQAPDLSPAELQELLLALHLGVLGLQTLVGNLLEGASIEVGRFRVSLRPSNLGEIFAEAIRMMQPLLDKYGQHLVVEVPTSIPIVRADPRRTVQVLINLLSNASKYGPDDSEIAIVTTVNQDWVRVSVVDQGPGIPPERRADLFRRFTRSDTSTDKAQYGVGLGLSVAKAIIEAHGGQVGISDRPGGGAIFWFTLPTEPLEDD